jgi:hypothetical protein
MKFNDKEIWRIIKTKKSERTAMEKVSLHDWKDQWVFTINRIIIFPFALIIKLYKWTFDI